MINFFRKKSANLVPKWDERKSEDFHFELIENYFKKKDNFAAFQTINAQLMDDIDFYDLFEFIDRTSSKIGQQYLYNQLLVISPDLHFEEQEAIADYFLQNEEKRLRAQKLFSKLNRRESFYISHLFLNDYIPKPKWFWVIPALSFAGLIAIVLTFFISRMVFLLVLLFFVNLAIHFWNKRNIMAYMDSIP
ncbi:MAG: DNA mismatch repair protein MutS, partial [Paludibacter sp.]|nr:DNA mismatch repair protein MutS [Paludibacter sp.]